MKNKGIFNLIRAAGFVALLLALTVTSSYMLAPKDNTAKSGINNPNANGFYSERENSIDIAVIGNSDAYSGFSPMELWNSYGYTSYVSAEGHQSTAQGYAQLKKIMRKHKLQLAIIETDSLYTNSKIAESAGKLINAATGSAFSVFQYHDRWKKVKPDELLKEPTYTAHCITKGQWLSNDVKGYMGGEYMKKSEKRDPIPFSSKAALDMTVKLCRDNDVQIILLEIPSQTSWNYKRHNAVADYAEKNGLPFVDLNIDREGFGFDWKTDTRDRGNHLNNRGAKKVTAVVGEYIKQNYSLTDRRGDKSFESWNKDYNDYIKKVKI